MAINIAINKKSRMLVIFCSEQRSYLVIVLMVSYLDKQMIYYMLILPIIKYADNIKAKGSPLIILQGIPY